MEAEFLEDAAALLASRTPVASNAGAGQVAAWSFELALDSINKETGKSIGDWGSPQLRLHSSRTFPNGAIRNLVLLFGASTVD